MSNTLDLTLYALTPEDYRFRQGRNMVEMSKLIDDVWDVSFYKDRNESEPISSTTYSTREAAIKAASSFLSADKPTVAAIYFQISNYIFHGCTTPRRVIA